MGGMAKLGLPMRDRNSAVSALKSQRCMAQKVGHVRAAVSGVNLELNQKFGAEHTRPESSVKVWRRSSRRVRVLRGERKSLERQRVVVYEMPLLAWDPQQQRKLARQL